jgi:hypothetical protein
VGARGEGRRGAPVLETRSARGGGSGAVGLEANRRKKKGGGKEGGNKKKEKREKEKAKSKKREKRK